MQRLRDYEDLWVGDSFVNKETSGSKSQDVVVLIEHCFNELLYFSYRHALLNLAHGLYHLGIDTDIVLDLPNLDSSIFRGRHQQVFPINLHSV